MSRVIDRSPTDLISAAFQPAEIAATCLTAMRQKFAKRLSSSQEILRFMEIARSECSKWRAECSSPPVHCDSELHCQEIKLEVELVLRQSLKLGLSVIPACAGMTEPENQVE